MVYSKCLISTVVNNFVQQVEKTTYFIFPVMQWDAMFKTGNFELSRSTEILEGWYCESSVDRGRPRQFKIPVLNMASYCITGKMKYVVFSTC